MAAITTAASGNWSATGTWTGGMVPGAGDTVTIATGHVVTVDADVTVGASLVDTHTTLAITTNGGTLLIAGGVVLTARGHVNFGTNAATELVMSDGAKLLLDSSASSSPTTTSYYLNLDGKVTISGTEESPCVIGSVLDNSAKTGYIKSGTSANNAISVNWLEIKDIGGSQTYSVLLQRYTYSPAVKTHSIKNLYVHGLAKRVRINFTGNHSITDVDFDRWHVEAIGEESYVDLQVPNRTTGKRNFTNSWIEKRISFGQSSLGGWTLDGTVFSGINTAIPATQPVASAKNCTIIDRLGTSGVCMLYTDEVTFENPFCIAYHFGQAHQEGIFKGAKFKFLDGVLENIGNYPAHPYLYSGLTNATQENIVVDISRNVFANSADGRSWGRIVQLKGTKHTALTFSKNTSQLDLGLSTLGLVAIAAGTDARGYVNNVVEMQDNLIWQSGDGDGYLLVNFIVNAVFTGTASADSTSTVLKASHLFDDPRDGSGSYVIKITSGSDSGIIRPVVSNSATEIVVSPAFPNSMATQTYELYPVNQVSLADYNAISATAQVGEIRDGNNVVSINDIIGYENLIQSAPSEIGAHDLSFAGSPGFVDSSRSVFTWPTAALEKHAGDTWLSGSAYAVGDIVSCAVSGFYGGANINWRCVANHVSSTDNSPGGWAHDWRWFWEPQGLYELRMSILGRAEATPGATHEALTAWIRGGYAPTNSLLSSGASDGGVFGAVAFFNPDITAPVLTDATATATGPTTVTASVSTDDGNGTLYFIASESATVADETILAALSQSVTTAGEQSISLAGLDPETDYYVFFIQTNAASLTSEQVRSALITTPAIVYPEISATVASPSTSAVSATVTTDTAGGTIYGVLSTSATEMEAADIKSGADDTATVTAAWDYTLGGTGLATWTQYYWHIVHEDTDGLMSNVLTLPVKTLDISISLAFSDTATATLLSVQVWSKMPKKADIEGLY